MKIDWDADTVVLVINRDDLPVDKETVKAVWEYCNSDSTAGETVGKFLVLGLAIMFKGVLQFLE